MTRAGHHGPANGHRECWELLPWIANERAAPSDVARVERHLRSCKACQDELQAQRRLRDMIRTETPVVLAPQTSLQKLMQRIDGQRDPDDAEPSLDAPADQPRVAAAAASPRAGSTGSPGWLRIAAAVQAVAIAVLLTAIWWQSREALTAARYTTLTTQTTTASGPVIRVVFTDDISIHDLSELVRSIDAQIVAGPSDAGVYTLALASAPAGAIDPQQAVDRLRADARVLFSELAIAHSSAP